MAEILLFALTTLRKGETVKNDPVIQGKVVCMCCNPSFLPHFVLQLYQSQTHLICSVTYLEAGFLPDNLQIMDLFTEALDFQYLNFNAICYVSPYAIYLTCTVMIICVLLCLVNKET